MHSTRERSTAVLVVVVVVVAVVVAALVGLGWGTFVAVIGTAVGTLGLAFYTRLLAVRTLSAVEASQQLEIAAREQADAARDAAQQAQQARLDELAPIIDLKITRGYAWYRGVGEGRGVEHNLAEIPDKPEPPVVDGPTYEAGTFVLTLTLTLRNFGKTPAFVEFRHIGIATPVPHQLLRVEPADKYTFDTTIDWAGGNERPGDAKTITFTAVIHGPLTKTTVDTLTWTGDVTLLIETGRGWQLNHRVGSEARTARDTRRRTAPPPSRP